MARRSAARPAGNLPRTVTSFVGRRLDLQRTKRRMGESRLVTLFGPGGVGKTRLALEVGDDCRSAFPDGVWMVDLASLSDPDRVAQAVVSALDVRDQSTRGAEEQLLDHLRDRHLLLLLDNCEHLLDACARLVGTILRSTADVRVLATSREGLGIDGEHLVRVSSLSVPDPDTPPPLAALPQYEAVGLLLDRARAVRPDFEVTDENRVAVARLCAALDGLPLAIELAATRLRSLAVDEVLDRLDDRFRLLNAGDRAALPRQQTLRALIDWSYELCSAQEQQLWVRASVFSGAFDLEAAEGVCADGALPRDAVVDLLDQLVAKSIVLADPDGRRLRYRMLVSVRHYGLELLREQDAESALLRRHRDHYVERARCAARDWCGPGQAEALQRSRADHPNIRAALQWSAEQEGEDETWIAFVAALRFHWVVGGFLREGRQWLDRALAGAGAPTRTRGEALWTAAWVSLVQGDAPVAAGRIDECRAVADDLGCDVLRAYADQWTGLAGLFDGRVEEAIPHFERALAGHRRAQDTTGILMTLFQLAPAQAYAGRTTDAAETCATAVGVADEHGERWAKAYALWGTGITAWHGGELEGARSNAAGALALGREFKDGICAALTIELLAWTAAADGRHEVAAHMMGAAGSVWSEIGTTMHAFGPHMDADSAAAHRRTSGALGAARMRTLTAETTGLGVDGAMAFALGGPRARDDADGSPLSPRETEVAELVAEGRSNRDIAAALVLSPRTIDGHVERILAKLGFASRAQIAAWVAEHAARQGA